MGVYSVSRGQLVSGTSSRFFKWWITPFQYPGHLLVLCDSFSMDVNFLKQTALVYISGVEGLSNYDMRLEVGLVCLRVLGELRTGLVHAKELLCY